MTPASPPSPSSPSPFSLWRRFFSRKWARRISIIVIIIMVCPFLLTIIYGIVAPPLSSLMVWRYIGGVSINKVWVDIEDMSPDLIRAVVISEDARICSHRGVDWREVANVFSDIRADKRARGASTIAMQLSKNLFLWPHRSVFRKILEVPLAFWMSMILSKRRLVEIYLNIAEWDWGIFGAEAAARHYFNKSASALNARESSLLAALLPSPYKRSAANPDSRTRALAKDLRREMARATTYLTCLARRSG